MLSDFLADPIQRTIANPRNVWSRALTALEYGDRRDFYRAERLLDTLKYNPDFPEHVRQIYARQIESARKRLDNAPQINIPVDYLSHQDWRLRKPFRVIRSTAKFPSPYPFSMAMPQLVGPRNDWSYMMDAATTLAEDLAHRIRHVQVILVATPETDIAATARMLADQSYDGTIQLTVFSATPDPTLSLPSSLAPRVLSCAFLSDEGQNELAELLEQTDLAVFLNGAVELDETALERAIYLARVSDNVMQPLAPLKLSQPLDTPFSTGKGKRLFAGRYPFRDMQGLNFVVSPKLLRRIGLFNTRFSSMQLAAQELGFRLFNLGGYFAPLRVPAVGHFRDDKAHPGDLKTYVHLCPNHWDRKKDGRFELPKVSVYIPAYNPSKYIERAIDSVLEQDVADLEVCIADDGSIDGTPDVLERRYGGDARVRWVTNPNGGIGFASNQAISMAHGLYIGQLDSDDCLKPGAVRRLMEYLDDHPEVSCCYGSCERIDADGAYVKDEYSWPVFSREKMMITSIAHHFRMFRRSAWERTTRFREDIVNAVDYDIFLKLSETGEFHHVEEVLYQRRWHGENTSNVNEGFQTTNTYRVQRETLRRLDLDRFWDVHIPNPDEPRRVTYKRREDRQMVLFWPNYSRNNPYQMALYGKAGRDCEICAGTIEAALKVIETLDDPGTLTFHLHWLNFLLRDVTNPDEARAKTDDFIARLEKFIWKGGRLVWTVHNTVSHDTPFADLEIELSARIARIAHVLHFHSAASVDEVAEVFEIPREKVVISRHGHYIGAYPDFVPRAAARRQLGLQDDDDVILFTGQIRPYKGVEHLIETFRKLLADRPKALLLIVGEIKFDLFAAITPALTEFERSRILATERFVDDMEFQLFFRAADMAVYPYQKILTSGSLLLALSFGVPVIIPEVGMTRETIAGRDAGILYDPDSSPDALGNALTTLLDRKSAGTLAQMAANARTVAEEQVWPDFSPLLK